MEIVNVNKGAIALGHPIGMSGPARATLRELRGAAGSVAAALCGAADRATPCSSSLS